MTENKSVTLTQAKFDIQSEENFVSCPSTFLESKGTDVNTFIDITQNCSNVSDANALRGLSKLLDDFAATCWQRGKDYVMWTSEIDSLHTIFEPKTPSSL